jgi:hypothetical protein
VQKKILGIYKILNVVKQTSSLHRPREFPLTLMEDYEKMDDSDWKGKGLFGLGASLRAGIAAPSSTKPSGAFAAERAVPKVLGKRTIVLREDLAASLAAPACDER